jgi:hypothetical protein
MSGCLFPIAVDPADLSVLLPFVDFYAYEFIFEDQQSCSEVLAQRSQVHVTSQTGVLVKLNPATRVHSLEANNRHVVFLSLCQNGDANAGASTCLPNGTSFSTDEHYLQCRGFAPPFMDLIKTRYNESACFGLGNNR